MSSIRRLLTCSTRQFKMKGPISLSLAEELRSIRSGNNGQMPSKRAQDREEQAAPWHSEMERMQHTLQEVLQAVSQFSGVELPGTSPVFPDGSNRVPRLDYSTLKDRIRNDLEAFSLRTASELSHHAEDQARAALGAVENEINGQIEQAAGQLREKLKGEFGTQQMQIDVAQQSKDRVADIVKSQTDEFARWVWLTCKGTETPTPRQIEKLLEPYIEEASATFAASLRKNAQDLIAEQAEQIQATLQAAAQSAKGQMGSLEKASLQACEQNAETVRRKTAERLSAAADEAVNGIEGKITGELDGALGRFKGRLAEITSAATADLQHDHARRAESFKLQIDGMIKEAQGSALSEISSHIAHTAAGLIDSSVQHMHHQLEDSMENSREEIGAFMKLETEGVRQGVHDLCLAAHQSLELELAATSDQHIADSREQLMAMIETCVQSMEERVRQTADQQLQEIRRLVQDFQQAAAAQHSAQLQQASESCFDSMLQRLRQEADQASLRVVADLKAASEPVLHELSEQANTSVAVLREEAAQAAARIRSSAQDSFESYRQQMEQITQAELEQQQSAVSGKMTELHNRLQQAAELLIAGGLNAH